MENYLPNFPKSVTEQVTANQQWNPDRATITKGSILPARLRSIVSLSNEEIKALDPPQIVETSTIRLEEVIASDGYVDTPYSRVDPSPIAIANRGRSSKPTLSTKHMKMASENNIDSVSKVKLGELLKVHVPVVTFIYDYDMHAYKRRPRSRLLPEASSKVKGITDCFGTLDYDRKKRDHQMNNSNKKSRNNTIHQLIQTSKTKHGNSEQDEDLDDDSNENHSYNNDHDEFNQESGDEEENELPEMDIFIKGQGGDKMTHLRLIAGSAVSRSAQGTNLQIPAETAHSPWDWSESFQKRSKEHTKLLEHSNNEVERIKVAQNGFCCMISNHIRLLISRDEFEKMEKLRIKKENYDELIQNSVMKTYTFQLNETLGVELEYDEDLNNVTVFELFGGGQAQRLGVLPQSVIISVRGENKTIGLNHDDPHHHHHHRDSHHHHHRDSHHHHSDSNHHHRPRESQHQHHHHHHQHYQHTHHSLRHLVQYEHKIRHFKDIDFETVRQQSLLVEEEHLLTIPTEFGIQSLIQFQHAVTVIKQVYSHMEITFMVPLFEINKAKEEALEEEQAKILEMEEKEKELNRLILEKEDDTHVQYRPHRHIINKIDMIEMISERSKSGDSDINLEEVFGIHNTTPTMSNKQNNKEQDFPSEIVETQIVDVILETEDVGEDNEDDNDDDGGDNDGGDDNDDDDGGDDDNDNNDGGDDDHDNNDGGDGDGSDCENIIKKEETIKKCGEQDNAIHHREGKENKDHQEDVIDKIEETEDWSFVSGKGIESNEILKTMEKSIPMDKLEIETDLGSFDDNNDDDSVNMLAGRKVLKTKHLNHPHSPAISVNSKENDHPSSLKTMDTMLKIASKIKPLIKKSRAELVKHTLRKDIPLHLNQSKKDDTPVNLHIINNSHFYLEVGWVNYNGSVVVRRVLPPGIAHVEVSYATHPWVFTTIQAPPNKNIDPATVKPADGDDSLVLRLGEDAAVAGNKGCYHFIWQPLNRSINLSQQAPQTKLARPMNSKTGKDIVLDSSSRVRNARMNLIKQLRSLRTDPTGTGVTPTITVNVMANEE